MKQIGKLFVRPALVLVMVMLVIVAALPGSASAMLALQTTDFNTCGTLTGWQFQNPLPVAGASAVTEGAFSGESYLKVTLPAGTYASITDGNMMAPRMVTPITDASFDIEVKYLAPQISTSPTGYKIEGLLFRNADSAANVQWLRIDFNSVNNRINSYISYMRTDTAGFIEDSKIDLDPITALNGGPTTADPILLRVNYNQTTGAWTVTYTMNGTATVRTFNESELPFPFVPKEMGLFVANSSSGALGHVSRVDYIHVNGTPLNDDNVKLTVKKVGSGTVNQISCGAGNVVSLNAVPTTGETFLGWTGADNNTANPTTVTMNTSKTVTATFSGASALNEKLFLPRISR